MSPKGAPAVAVALACAGLIAGCGGGGSDETNAGTTGGEAGLTFQVSGDEPELSAYPKLIEAYEAKTGQQVNLVKVGKGQNFQKLTTAFAAGDPPDVFLSSYTDFGSFAEKGKLDAVGPKLTKPDPDAQATSSTEPIADDYYPQARDAFTFDGELQCMPQDLSSPVVFYNIDQFKKAGVEVPADDWTYDQFKSDAQKLKESLKSEPHHYAVGLEPDMERLASFVFAAGGQIVDDQKAPTGFTLDTPEARQGLQAFFGLAPLAPPEAVFESKEPDEQFTEGAIAMFVDSRMEVTKLRAIKDFDWDVAPFPKIAEGASSQHSDGYCISKGADAQAAWQFVQFATGAEGQKLLAASGRIMPALESVAKSDTFLAPNLKPKNSQVFLDAIPGMKQLPNAPNWAGVQQASHFPIEEGFFESARVPDLNEVVEEFVQNLIRETEAAFKGQAEPDAGEPGAGEPRPGEEPGAGEPGAGEPK